MNELIKKAAKLTKTPESEWRNEGPAAVHKNVTLGEDVNILGPAIFRGGNFYGGNFYDGNFRSGNFYGGNFHDGNFYGGNFYDGNFRGRNFYGGNFHYGDFCGGSFYDGNFHDGNFYGGIFYGGIFYGGNFHYGDFCGGSFYDGNFRGGIFRSGIFYDEEWKRSPVFVQGTRHWVCESDNGYIASGCMREKAEWWLENVERVAEEHGYTPEQQAEYREIFEFVSKQIKAVREGQE